MLAPGGAKGGKRQLDCAGVVTTTHAACQRLAQRHGHADLAGCSMSISEDHCWLQLGGGGAAAGSAAAEGAAAAAAPAPGAGAEAAAAAPAPGAGAEAAAPPAPAAELSRERSVEVTTDSAPKRGLPASEESFRGWLYTGGRAVLCCRQRALGALVNSLNPSITPGKKGQDSEQLQALQWRLLRLLWCEARGALYPAALCSLGDLEEVSS